MGVSDGPADPIGELGAAAVQLHELYRTYVSAGFTAGQAMQIVLTVLTASIQQQGGNPGG